MKYLRLLRLQDQYIQLGCAIASGIYLNIKDWSILFWAIATTFFSFTAFMINELTDRQDVDINSWNSIHVQKNIKYNNWILAILFIIFSILGLYIAYLVNLFWWGFAMYLIGLFYSLKPIRLKGRLIFDIIAQLSVWWFIPFIAPISLHQNLSSALIFIITHSLLSWSIFYPYQLADFKADLKAGFKSTHIMLGLDKSLILGLLMGLAGLLIYFKLNMFQNYPWTVALMFLTVTAIYSYQKWLKIKSTESKLHSMQLYVVRFKPLTQLLLPYLLIWYFI